MKLYILIAFLEPVDRRSDTLLSPIWPGLEAIFGLSLHVGSPLLRFSPHQKLAFDDLSCFSLFLLSP